jgi:hypothetical protein
MVSASLYEMAGLITLVNALLTMLTASASEAPVASIALPSTISTERA